MAESDLAIRPEHPLWPNPTPRSDPAIRPNEKAHQTVRFLLLRGMQLQ